VRYGATCCWGSVLAGHEFHLSLKIDGIRMGWGEARIEADIFPFTFFLCGMRSELAGTVSFSFFREQSPDSVPQSDLIYGGDWQTWSW